MNTKINNLSILILFVAYSCISEVNAVRCYKCDSRYDKRCLRGGSDIQEQTCPSFVKSCVKIFGTFNFKEYVGRSCNSISECAISGIAVKGSNANHQVRCDTCETNLCNSADSLIKSKQIGFIGVVVAFMIRKILF